MTTDKTQELDKIIDKIYDLAYDHLSDRGIAIGTVRIKRAILDWHNNQVEALLDRLESMAAYDPSGSSPVINQRQIEAERNKTIKPNNRGE